jgi:glyoxylase-like metal-dependent hydrolase (beta-lactamase superfamily II)
MPQSNCGSSGHCRFAITNKRNRRGADTIMDVRFWGTRGGIAVPGPATLKYGGNTSCVEVCCGPHRVILDAGTGLRLLGNALVANEAAVNVDILLSHLHLDHIIGLGFFAPLYRRATQLRIHAGNLTNAELQATGFRGVGNPSLTSPTPNTRQGARMFMWRRWSKTLTC